MRIEEVYESTVVERDEHRKSRAYKKLSPKMRKAVDEIFKNFEAQNKCEFQTLATLAKYSLPDKIV